uniref:Uncharacterized protein n=1 Tax=Maylandia zebra TaxID=106582 RepID=A0A3P9BXL4_9CICH
MHPNPLPSIDPTHPWKPGDAVLVKSLKPRALGEAACSSPQTVLAVTRTSILTDGQPQWIHASRVKTSPTKPPKISSDFKKQVLSFPNNLVHDSPVRMIINKWKTFKTNMSQLYRPHLAS